MAKLPLNCLSACVSLLLALVIFSTSFRGHVEVSKSRNLEEAEPLDENKLKIRVILGVPTEKIFKELILNIKLSLLGLFLLLISIKSLRNAHEK